MKVRKTESGVEKISTMTRASACTEEKLSELIDTYDKLVFSICYKLTGDYFMAEDLMQETFLSAFQKYDSFDGSNEKAWICRIATNKSIDYMRSAGRRSVPTEDAFFETGGGTAGLARRNLYGRGNKRKVSRKSRES